tara:strand:- start:341 stop:1180 length:840 start_codon:yes stop_codon:yes gene_type:complete
VGKKFKKYKKIHEKHGLDGIYYYFLNKNIKKTGLNNFIDKKKNTLGKIISNYSKQKILYGPYKNTKIINSFSWSNIDAASKYLGTYESHIQEKIIELTKKFKLKFFIDLGAAEGYHLISLVKKNFFLKGFAFEINKQSRILLKKNALANKVTNKIKIFSKAEFDTMKNILSINQLNKALFLVDIEGHEFSLFNEKFCTFFSNSFFIIEDHNFNEKSKKKKDNFYKIVNKYFKVEIINDRAKNPFDYKILDSFTDDEKYLMISEGRPKTMQWLILFPKKK